MYVNWAIALLIIALLLELFSKPRPPSISSLLKVIGALIAIASKLFSDSGLSDSKMTDEQQKGNKKLSIILTFVATFFVLASLTVH